MNQCIPHPDPSSQPPSSPDPSGSGEVTFVGHQPLASGSFGTGRMCAISANLRWLPTICPAPAPLKGFQC